ncbi:MAG TPA: BMP family ABC transporter substrate-binding protein [Mycobacteriales bacterium]|nr:BMP family ABC transporter substrate-binding protein [Mycobacteriales bacterium]
MKQVLRSAVAIAAVALAVAACGSKPKDGGDKASSGFNGCLVTDTGGVDDRSFNESASDGLKSVDGVGYKLQQSQQASDYKPNIESFLHSKCGVIITVGGLMGDVTQQEAEANPKQKFIGIDQSFAKPIKNVKALIYDTSQAGYLVGYLAAGMTKTGTVGTFGGQKLPTVTIYMDGFAEGIAKYNSVHHKSVKLLGWNEKSQNGSFTNDFQDQDKGKQISQQFINQGADIIFPVAGNAGLGAPAAAKADSSGKTMVIWVDTDGCASSKQYCKYFLTTAEKSIAKSVNVAVTAAKDGSFSGENYLGTLKNGGVGIAPYHDFESKVPASLKKEVEQLKQDIISGKITVHSPSAPKG